MMGDNSRNFSNNNFSGANFGDNTSFQSDDVNQSKTVGHDTNDEKMFAELLAEIKKLTDSDDRQDAEENLAKLKEAKGSSNMERARKVFGWLPEVVKLSAAGVDLAHSLGLM